MHYVHSDLSYAFQVLPDNMAIVNSKRATSTPSVGPNMLCTPDSTTSAANDSVVSKTTTEARLKVKSDIERHLKNDQHAILYARTRVRKAADWDSLDGGKQERILKEAALNAIQYRKDRGTHVSSFYPVFKDYTAPNVEGKRTRSKDILKEFLLNKQIDLLESQGSRGIRDEESDDEEPNPFLKKEEGEETPTIEDSAHRQSMNKHEPLGRDLGMFSKSAKAALPPPKQQTKSTTTPRHRSVTEPSSENENDEYESDLSDLESSSEEDSESASDSEDDSPVSLVAVLRGQPIHEDLTPPTPSKSAMRRRKHRPAKITNNTLVAVLRGEIVQKHDPADVEWVWMEKKGFTPKKRVRGGGEAGPKVETRGQENKHKNKKARVEAGV